MCIRNEKNNNVVMQAMHEATGTVTALAALLT
jgi:hypothetical protein